MKKQYLSLIFIFTAISSYSQIKPSQFMGLIRSKSDHWNYNYFLNNAYGWGDFKFEKVFNREENDWKCIVLYDKIHDQGISIDFDIEGDIKSATIYFSDEGTISAFKNFFRENNMFQKKSGLPYSEILNARLLQKIYDNDVFVGGFTQNSSREPIRMPCSLSYQPFMYSKYSVAFNARLNGIKHE